MSTYQNIVIKTGTDTQTGEGIGSRITGSTDRTGVRINKYELISFTKKLEKFYYKAHVVH